MQIIRWHQLFFAVIILSCLLWGCGEDHNKPASIVISADKVQAAADGNDPIIVIAVVKDSAGAVISGEPVVFKVEDGQHSTSTTRTTDINGLAIMALTHAPVDPPLTVNISAACASVSSNTIAGTFTSVNTLAIMPAGDGLFSLQLFGLTSVVGIDVTITYDTTTLANPRIVREAMAAGSMFQTNTNVPGTIRVAAITTKDISGSGTLATIAFDRLGGSPGGIKSMTASLISPNLELPATTTFVFPPSQ